MVTSEIRAPASAVWIGSAHPFDLHEVYLDFRRAFDLGHPLEPATLFITADSRYRLWANGAFVARGPARCWPQAQAVDALDLTPHLRAGPNTLAVQVYQPGYSHFAYVHRGAAGLLAWLEVGGRTSLATDTTWRVRRDPAFQARVERVSIYGGGVEDRNLSAEDDWQRPEYDDEHWAAARLAAQTGAYPWLSLHSRDLPLLVEREQPLTLVEARLGPAQRMDVTPGVRHLHPERSTAALRPRAVEGGAGPGTRPKADLHPAEAHLDPHLTLRAGWPAAAPARLAPDDKGWFAVDLLPGEAAYWLLDLGRDYHCQGWAEIEGALGGETLLVSYAETIRGGQLVLSDPDTYCRVRLTDRFRLRPGAQVAESFALRGGRYLLFRLSGPGGPVGTTPADAQPAVARAHRFEASLSGPDGRAPTHSPARRRLRFHARIAEYPLAVTHPLEVSDPALARIAAMCEATFRACLADGFVDSTWREGTQWVGDALPQALVMASVTGDVRPLRRVLLMAAQGAYPDGVLPSVLPAEVHAYTVVDYNLSWVELLALYFNLTRDAALVAGLWPTLTRLLQRFHQDAGADGLIRSQPGRRLFLDWAPLSRDEPSAVYNLRYLLALQTAARLAADLGQPADSGRWAGRAISLQAACRSAFWDDLCWRDDPAGTTFSQLAAALAVLGGAARSDEAPALLEAIAARSLDASDEPAPGRMVLASPFMHHYLFEALRLGGRAEAVVEIIRRRWGRWAEAGYPTTWENWSVAFPDGSQCHAFSAHPRYHLAQLERDGLRL